MAKKTRLPSYESGARKKDRERSAEKKVKKDKSDTAKGKRARKRRNLLASVTPEYEA